MHTVATFSCSGSSCYNERVEPVSMEMQMEKFSLHKEGDKHFNDYIKSTLC